METYINDRYYNLSAFNEDAEAMDWGATDRHEIHILTRDSRQDAKELVTKLNENFGESFEWDASTTYLGVGIFATKRETK